MFGAPVAASRVHDSPYIFAFFTGLHCFLHENHCTVDVGKVVGPRLLLFYVQFTLGEPGEAVLSADVLRISLSKSNEGGRHAGGPIQA